MDGTILGQGTFTQGATAVNQTIAIPSGVDWLKVYNFTQASGVAGNGFSFYWQRGFPGGRGIVESSGALGAVSVTTTALNAFRLYDPSQQQIGALNNGSTGVTGFTAANPAVVTVGSTSGIGAGAIVRFSGLDNQPQYNGIDYSIGYGTLTGTTFSVDYLNATGSTPSTDGDFRVVGFRVITSTGNPLIFTNEGLFYPKRRTITNITAASQAVITLSVDHGYTVGQQIRLSFPGGSALWGSYANLDNYNNFLGNSTTPNSYTIVAVNTATGVGNNTITINADTTGFGAFAFPPSTAVPFSPAQVVPIGEDTATAIQSNVDLLRDATTNTGFLGMTLAAGALLPGGSANDQIFWVAGKSTYGGL